MGNMPCFMHTLCFLLDDPSPPPTQLRLGQAGCSCGRLERTPGEHFFADFTFETFTQASLHGQSITYSSIFLTDLRDYSGFCILKLFFTNSFLALPWWSNNPEFPGESAFGDRSASSMFQM